MGSELRSSAFRSRSRFFCASVMGSLCLCGEIASKIFTTETRRDRRETPRLWFSRTPNSSQVSPAVLQQRRDRDRRGFRAQRATAQGDDLPTGIASEMDLVVSPSAFRADQRK